MENRPRRHKPLPSRGHFLRRMGRSISMAAVLVAASLGLGMLGYHGFEGMN